MLIGEARCAHGGGGVLLEGRLAVCSHCSLVTFKY